MSLLSLGVVAVLGPLAAAVALMLLPTVRRSTTAPGFSTVVAFCSLAASLSLLGRWAAEPELTWAYTKPWIAEGGRSMADVGIFLDGTSVVMLCIVSLVAFCVQLYSLEYMGHEPVEDQGRYFTWQSLFLFSMQALVVAPDMLQLFMSWELVGLCSYLLIGFYWRKPAAGRAALKAFWMTKLADVGFLLALVLHYKAVGSFAWTSEVAGQLAGAGALTTVVALYFVGVMGKSGQFPLHVWLPDAMEGPTPVSALLHAATMVAAGVYLVVRAFPLFEAATAVLPVMAVIGGFTAIFAACAALVQRDIKKILAYSTVSQLGYMVAALGAGSVFAGYFHLGTHAFFKALLFLAAGSAIHAVHSNDIFDMGGLRKKMPVTAALFAIGAAALAGIPMLSGFFSKDAILEALLHAAWHQPIYWLPFAACTATVFLTAVYMARATAIAFYGEEQPQNRGAHEPGPAMTAPMVLLGLGAVTAGFAGGFLMHALGVEGHFDPLHIAPIGFTGIALAVLGGVVGWRVHSVPALAPVARFIARGWVDRSWAWGYRTGLLTVAGGIAWFDRYVIDGLMNAIGAGSLRAGEWVRSWQTGRANDYLLAVVLGALALAAWSQVGG